MGPPINGLINGGFFHPEISRVMDPSGNHLEPKATKPCGFIYSKRPGPTVILAKPALCGSLPLAVDRM